MKVVIVADIDIADDVGTCVLGYSSKKGWEEIEVTPRPLPQREKVDERYMNDGLLRCTEIMYAGGWNDCLNEITGETE